MRRDDLRRADPPTPFGLSPMFLLSKDVAFRVRNLFIASTASARVRNLTTENHLVHVNGLRKPSVANSDVLIAIAKSFVRDRIGSLGRAKMLYVDVAIHFALGLDD